VHKLKTRCHQAAGCPFYRVWLVDLKRCSTEVVEIHAIAVSQWLSPVAPRFRRFKMIVDTAGAGFRHRSILLSQQHAESDVCGGSPGTQRPESECNLGSLHTLTVTLVGQVPIIEAYLFTSSSSFGYLGSATQCQICCYTSLWYLPWRDRGTSLLALLATDQVCIMVKTDQNWGLFQRWFHWLGTWQAIKSCWARSECSVPVGCRPQHL
jgi:hypothetical protein